MRTVVTSALSWNWTAKAHDADEATVAQLLVPVSVLVSFGEEKASAVSVKTPVWFATAAASALQSLASGADAPKLSLAVVSPQKSSTVPAVKLARPPHVSMSGESQGRRRRD